MRVDAGRNQERLLRAARDVFIERGPGASNDEIARRAGVGIGTLYRRFADRATLVRAVVLAALDATIEASERARQEHDDPVEAFAGYVYAVLELRTAALVPALLESLAHEPDVDEALRNSVKIGEELFRAARRTGGLRRDVTFGDVAVMLIRLTAPLPGGLPAEVQIGLERRHAGLFLSGLSMRAGGEPLVGQGVELSELQLLRTDADGTSRADFLRR